MGESPIMPQVWGANRKPWGCCLRAGWKPGRAIRLVSDTRERQRLSVAVISGSALQVSVLMDLVPKGHFSFLRKKGIEIESGKRASPLPQSHYLHPISRITFHMQLKANGYDLTPWCTINHSGQRPVGLCPSIPPHPQPAHMLSSSIGPFSEMLNIINTE